MIYPAKRDDIFGRTCRSAKRSVAVCVGLWLIPKFLLGRIEVAEFEIRKLLSDSLQ
jgi:hypothetical protein